MYYFEKIDRFFNLSRKVVNAFFAFLALATVLLGNVCGADVQVSISLLIIEGFFYLCCYLILFFAEQACKTPNNLANRLGAGLMAIGLVSLIVGAPAYAFDASLLADICKWVTYAGVLSGGAATIWGMIIDA